MDLRIAQKAVYKNKIDKGFNVTDVAIYLLGLSEILGIDLSSEIEKR